jgi:GT2 family glycosyltransferase
LIDVAVIVVSYNTRELLRACLASIFEHTKGCRIEVAVVDNASADGTPAMVRDAFPQVRLVANTDNRGFGAANNQAIRESRARYLFLLNPDTRLADDAISTFAAFMDRPGNERVAGCGGGVLTPDGAPAAAWGNLPTVPIKACQLFGPLRAIGRAVAGTRLQVSLPAPGPESPPFDVPYISGADLFLRRAALDEVGLFDEDFFLYFEETELCARIVKAGWRLVLLPAVRVFHDVGAAVRGGIAEDARIPLFRRSEYLFFEKASGMGAALAVRAMAVAKHLPGVLLYAPFSRRKFSRAVAEVKAALTPTGAGSRASRGSG